MAGWSYGGVVVWRGGRISGVVVLTGVVVLAGWSY